MSTVSDGRDDGAIIAASIRSPSRFETIFDRHFDAVMRFATTRVGNHMAADVASETFVRAFALRHRFSTSRPDARPWLYGIATNVIRETLRDLARGRRAFERAAGRSGGPTPDFSGDTDHRVDAAARVEELGDALRALSEDEAAVLVLAATPDVTYAEMAEILEIPIGTVRSRLSRARRRARELILPERPILDEPTSDAVGRSMVVPPTEESSAYQLISERTTPSP